MKSDFVNDNGLIKPNADFKQVANDIVNNMELWRVEGQIKTEVALRKIISNMEIADAKRAKAKAESAGKPQLDNSHFGYGNKKVQGD